MGEQAGVVVWKKTSQTPKDIFAGSVKELMVLNDPTMKSLSMVVLFTPEDVPSTINQTPQRRQATKLWEEPIELFDVQELPELPREEKQPKKGKGPGSAKSLPAPKAKAKAKSNSNSSGKDKQLLSEMIKKHTTKSTTKNMQSKKKGLQNKSKNKINRPKKKITKRLRVKPFMK